MGDSKNLYSESSRIYVDIIVNDNQFDKDRFTRSKEREKKFGVNWEKNKVNLNEIVKKFSPNAIRQSVGGIKFVFKGDKYDVICDKVAGYLRVYDKEIKRFVRLDGVPDTNEKTHFKILKRSEM